MGDELAFLGGAGAPLLLRLLLGKKKGNPTDPSRLASMTDDAGNPVWGDNPAVAKAAMGKGPGFMSGLNAAFGRGGGGGAGMPSVPGAKG